MLDPEENAALLSSVDAVVLDTDGGDGVAGALSSSSRRTSRQRSKSFASYLDNDFVQHTAGITQQMPASAGGRGSWIRQASTTASHPLHHDPSSDSDSAIVEDHDTLVPIFSAAAATHMIFAAPQSSQKRARRSRQGTNESGQNLSISIGGKFHAGGPTSPRRATLADPALLAFGGGFSNEPSLLSLQTKKLSRIKKKRRRLRTGHPDVVSPQSKSVAETVFAGVTSFSPDSSSPSSSSPSSASVSSSNSPSSFNRTNVVAHSLPLLPGPRRNTRLPSSSTHFLPPSRQRTDYTPPQYRHRHRHRHIFSHAEDDEDLDIGVLHNLDGTLSDVTDHDEEDQDSDWNVSKGIELGEDDGQGDDTASLYARSISSRSSGAQKSQTDFNLGSPMAKSMGTSSPRIASRGSQTFSLITQRGAQWLARRRSTLAAVTALRSGKKSGRKTGTPGSSRNTQLREEAEEDYFSYSGGTTTDDAGVGTSASDWIASEPETGTLGRYGSIKHIIPASSLIRDSNDSENKILSSPGSVTTFTTNFPLLDTPAPSLMSPSSHITPPASPELSPIGLQHSPKSLAEAAPHPLYLNFAPLEAAGRDLDLQGGSRMECVGKRWTSLGSRRQEFQDMSRSQVMFYSPLTGVIRAPTFADLSGGSSSPTWFERQIRSGTFWLDVTTPSDTDLDLLTETFHIHPLTLEDIIAASDGPASHSSVPREKCEHYGHYLLICLNTLDLHEHSSTFLSPITIWVMVFEAGVVTVHFGAVGAVKRAVGKLAGIWEGVKRQDRMARKTVDLKADVTRFFSGGWVVYLLVDEILDQISPLVTRLDAETEAMEDLVLYSWDEERMRQDGLAVPALEDCNGDDSEDDEEDMAGGQEETDNLLPRSAPRPRRRRYSTVDRVVQVPSKDGRPHFRENREPLPEFDSTGSDTLKRLHYLRKRVGLLNRVTSSKSHVIRAVVKKSGTGLKVERIISTGHQVSDDVETVTTITTLLPPELSLYFDSSIDRAHSLTDHLSHLSRTLTRSSTEHLAHLSHLLTSTSKQSAAATRNMTGIVTLLVPLGLVTGIMGMNVKVPGQDYEGIGMFFAYTMVMGWVVLIMFWVVKRWHWFDDDYDDDDTNESKSGTWGMTGTTLVDGRDSSYGGRSTTADSDSGEPDERTQLLPTKTSTATVSATARGWYAATTPIVTPVQSFKSTTPDNTFRRSIDKPPSRRTSQCVKPVYSSSSTSSSSLLSSRSIHRSPSLSVSRRLPSDGSFTVLHL